NDNGNVIRVQDSRVTIIGLTITNGNDQRGGGINAVSDDLLSIQNCIISSNIATIDGGAIYHLQGPLELINTQVLNNESYTTGGGLTTMGDSVHIFDTQFIGNIANNAGGAIYDQNSILDIHESFFRNNSVVGQGGGLYAQGGQLSISSSSFENNLSSGAHAGAIYLGVSASFDSLIFRSNSAQQEGGALQVENGNTTIAHSLFFDNTAGSDGQAISLGETAGLDLQFCTLGENGVVPGSLVLFEDSNLQLSNSILWGNPGAEIVVLSSLNPCIMVIDYCDIENGLNGIDDQSGDLALTWGVGNLNVDPQFESDTTYALLNSSPCVDAGDPDYDGDGDAWDIDPDDQDPDGTRMDMGAYYYHQALAYVGPVWHVSTEGSDETGDGSEGSPFATIQFGIDASLSGDTVLVQPGTYLENINYTGKNILLGSLLLTTDDSTYIQQTVIDAGEAPNAVEFSSNEDSTAVLLGFTILNGALKGIFCENSSPSIRSCTISHSMRGIWCWASSPRINDVVVTNNDESGIWIGYESHPFITNSTISNNNGGGIHCTNYSNPTLVDVHIEGNHVSSGYGGGFFADNWCNPQLLRVKILANQADEGGGGIYVGQNSTVNLDSTLITNNYAPNQGGGIRVSLHGILIANRTEISSNSSNYDSGNYYGEPGSTVSLANCTVYGAGIYLQGLQEYSTVANYSNSILWVSSVHVESFTDMNVSFSVLQGGESGVTGDVSGSSFTSVIDDDPLFTDSAGGDLSLTGISPCIDAGDPGSPFDPDGTIADMGAYYYHQVPAYDGPVWHVSTAGSDETGDGSEGSPFASIQVGVNSANQSDTIQVGPGTFTADINIQSKSLHILGVDSASTIIAADVVYAQAHIQGQVVTYERLRFESNGTGGDYMAWAECTDCVGEDSILVQLRDVAADGSNEKGFLLTGQRTKLQISNSQFLNFYTQIASWNGSVFSLSKSNASFDHCAFSNNQSNGSGHVLYASDSSSVNINFSSFSGNGSSPGSIALADGSDLVLANSILWGTPNFQIVILDEGAACSVNTSYCDIANGILGIEDQSGNLVLNWGNGNINQLPQFVSVSDLSLQATSPCIDTGDPESPLDPDGTRADMGAYYFDQISNSPHITISSDFMSFTVNKAESFERSQTLTISNVGSLPLEVAISTDSIIVMDVDGNLYPTIQIGNQVWMAENLKVTHYRDGTAITNESDDDNWAALTTEAYCIYNNNAANEANLFGALYNWYAVEDTRNIAPEGWHVPTEAEWKELEVTLGMDVIEANTYGWRGTNEGSMLAGNENLWVEGDLVTNSQFAATDFNAIPGGLRPNNSGNYEFMGTHSYFWSSTAEGDFGWSRGLYYNYSFPGRTLDGKNNGFSIRCIKNLTTSQVDISVMKSNQVYNEADAIQNRSVPISETRWDNHQNWLTINHTSLSIQPGASSDVTVTVNAEGLDLGEYINNIVIFNNDPTRNIIEVPVSMRVISQDTIPPEIQLNVPDITAPLQNGDTLNVTWEASDNIALDWAKLFFTSNGGASFSLYDSVDANLGEVDWIAPDIIAGGCNFALWVSDQAGNISADTLAGNFSIDDGTLPTINILTPTLSSTVPEGDTLFVSWEASDNVGIEWFELWFSNQPSEPFSDIMQIPSTDTSFAFGVGEGVSDSARIKIVVLDLAANSAEAYSEYFAITDNTHPVISYFAIPDTTDWGIGSFMDISVVASDNVEVTGLDLNYSTDAGASWQTIIDDLYPVQGLPTYTWLVPDSPGECQIQAVIMDAVGLTDTSYSDVFSIFVEYPQMVASLHEIRPDGDMLIQFSQIMDSLDYMSGTQVVGSVHGLYEIEGSLSGYDLTLSAPEGFVSLDTLQLVLSSSSWTNSFGYSLDGNDDGIWGGNSEDNDTSFTVVTAAGDYDQNGILDFDDFDDFVIAWHNDVTEYELAPHQGEIPFINIQPDSSFDIYDLATFASMWNWAAGLSLSPPLTESFQYEEFISEQSGNELILSLPRSEYIASQTIIKYDPTIVQISVMDNELAKVSASSLSFVDVNPDSGFILITSSHLTGSNEDDLSLKLIPDTRHRYSIEIAFQGSDMDAEVVQKRSLVDLLPIPTSYSLSQNYPNPFNASTTIEYGLPKNTELNLSIYDIRGRFVREIYSGGKQAGYHITQWNGTNDGGRNVASGLYFIVLNTPEYRVARKALILK
ncbi:MAG: T9SS type A sorting domain-containing protein, partial [Candidatus Marinimicrobia bacterium]|nr:T9SS type A sorting domain-containing protein [Candidatus Neomarinimicrobiota bacterium]